MVQSDLSFTNPLAHLCHLRPGSLSALVKRLLVLLGCRLIAAGLLLAEPDHHRLAGARDVSALSVCVPPAEAVAPVAPCKLLVYPVRAHLYVRRE